MPTFRTRWQGPGTAGDIWVTTLHTTSSQSIDSVHGAIETFTNNFFGSTMAPLWSADVQLSEVVTDELDPTTGRNVQQRRSGSTIKGSGTGQMPTPRAAVVCGLRTALPTRSGRGRMYVPSPGTDNLVATGLLSETVAGNISGALAGYLQTLAATATAVIYHRADLTTTAVTDVTVGVVLGSQARRTNKVPNNYQATQL